MNNKQFKSKEHKKIVTTQERSNENIL